jgi:hypothetical protein
MNLDLLPTASAMSRSPALSSASTFCVAGCGPAGERWRNSPETGRELHVSVNLPLPIFVQSMNVLQRMWSEFAQGGVVSTGRPPTQTRPPEA